MRLTRPPADDARHCMLAAEVDGRVVALAEYDATHEAEVAEIAFMVEDEQQGRGLGTALLESLVQRGAGTWHPSLSRRLPPPERADARGVRPAGFEVRWDHGDAGLGGVDFELVPTNAWLDAHAERDDVAQARSIARLLSPRSIAVIGAGRHARLDRAGHRRQPGPRRLHRGRPSGQSARDDDRGPTDEPTVLAIPGPVDLAVIAVPAAAVIEVAGSVRRSTSADSS